MTASSPRGPLINRPLVGILAIISLVSGTTLAFRAFDDPWAGSLIRVGILLAVLWMFLAPAKGTAGSAPAPKAPAASWITMALAGFALAAVRSRKPGVFFVVGLLFAVVAFVVKPRKK